MNEKEKKNNLPRFNLNWIYGIIAIALILLWLGNPGSKSSSKNVTYTQFKQYVSQGYASKIVANKDEGVLEMFVKPEHIQDVFQ